MKSTMSSCRRNRRQAFTLVELLITIGIIAILGAIALQTISSARNRALMAEELSAGRQLMNAFHMHAEENNGEVIPGYADSSTPAKDEYGAALHNPVSARYPYRLMPTLPVPLRALSCAARTSA